MSDVRNISNGHIYELYWTNYAKRPELIAVPENNVFKVIRNADRMDYVTISPDAVRALNEVSSSNLKP